MPPMPRRWSSTNLPRRFGWTNSPNSVAPTRPRACASASASPAGRASARAASSAELAASSSPGGSIAAGSPRSPASHRTAERSTDSPGLWRRAAPRSPRYRLPRLFGNGAPRSDATRGKGDGPVKQCQWNERMRAYRPVLERHALRLCKDRDEACDLVQDTLERAWRHSASFGTEPPPRAWLLRVLTNLYFDHRKQSRPVIVSLPVEDIALEPPPPPPATPEDAMGAL